MDFTLGTGSPDTDIGGGVSFAWVHLRRSSKPPLGLSMP
jgi:hypothetical protein